MTFLHNDWPEGAMIQTDSSGNVIEKASDGIMQTVLAGVDVDFVPWSAKDKPDFKRDGFAFFDEEAHYSRSPVVSEFATLANSNKSDLEIGDIAKVYGVRYARAFQREAVKLLYRHEPSLKDHAIMVPTQAMLRKASGPGSSGRYLPHVDFDYRQRSDELVAPWWDKSWGKYIVENASVWEFLSFSDRWKAYKPLVDNWKVDKPLTAAEMLEDPIKSKALFDLFSEAFEICGLQTVWVALNDTPCYNNQLALCSWPSIDKERDLKVYEIFGPGIKAIGLHPNEKQRWYAPATLQFGQGVRFDAMMAPHVAVAREVDEHYDGKSEPRLSVECRVLMLRKISGRDSQSEG